MTTSTAGSAPVTPCGRSRRPGPRRRSGTRPTRRTWSRLGSRVEPPSSRSSGPGIPADAALELAAAEGLDEIVLGPRPDRHGETGGLGGTTRSILDGADRPVVVVPVGAGR